MLAVVTTTGTSNFPTMRHPSTSLHLVHLTGIRQTHFPEGSTEPADVLHIIQAFAIEFGQHLGFHDSAAKQHARF